MGCDWFDVIVWNYFTLPKLDDENIVRIETASFLSKNWFYSWFYLFSLLAIAYEIDHDGFFFGFKIFVFQIFYDFCDFRHLLSFFC